MPHFQTLDDLNFHTQLGRDPQANAPTDVKAVEVDPQRVLVGLLLPAVQK